ncbi:MAG: porin family protein [Acetobacter sp.]|nr:porin family protein [Acetobacter sp.]
MKKLLSLVCIFTVIASQLAQARSSYRYEQAGYDQPQYIEYDGVRYTRVPENVVYERQPQYEQPRYEQPRYIQPQYEQPRYTQPIYVQSRPQPVVYNNAPQYPTYNVHPYVGFDVGYSSLKLNDKKDLYDLKSSHIYLDDIFDTKHMNYTGVLGLKINPYLAVELFYQQAQESKKKILGAHTDFSDSKIVDTLSYKAIGVDLLGMHPLGDTLDILFGLGVAQYSFDGKVSESFYNYTIDNGIKLTLKDDDDVMAMRWGIGLQYHLTDHIAVQSMARYIRMLDTDLVKSMLEVSLGLRYIF